MRPLTVVIVFLSLRQVRLRILLAVLYYPRSVNDVPVVLAEKVIRGVELLEVSQNSPFLPF